LGKALVIRPNSGITHLSLAIAYCRDNQLKVAQEHFEQTLRLARPRETAAYYDIYGMELLKNDHPAESLAQLAAGYRLNPHGASTNNNLGVALAALGRVPEAVHYFQEAVRLAPDFADPHCNLGVVLTGEGKWDEAIVQMKETLRIEPRRLQAHFFLATALRQRGFLQEAISHYEETLRIDPNFEPARESLRQLDRPVLPAR
jgi:tetratricopeptide (TPR) repeat protein